MKTARPHDQRLSGKSSRLPEPAEPEQIVVYLWGRIFAALFVLILVVGGIIWGALEIFGSGEQKEALAENQGVESPSLLSVYVDQPASAETASIQLPKTALSDSSAEPAPLPAPATGESEPFREEAASITLLSDHVTRAQLSTGLEEKEPIDEIPNVVAMDSDGLIRIYLFTEIQGMEGQLQFHDWYLEDERVARVEIRQSVGPMRASSAKFIDRHMVGDWRVEVVTEEGELLAKGEFSVLPL